MRPHKRATRLWSKPPPSSIHGALPQSRPLPAAHAGPKAPPLTDERRAKVTIVKERPAAGFEAARRAMIDSQLRTEGVNAEWVLRRMADVPRERFVPESARAMPTSTARFARA